jgi:hypothetical protein
MSTAAAKSPVKTDLGAAASTPISVSYAAASRPVWRRCLLFLSILSVAMALPVYLVDPYNIFPSAPRIVSPQIKREYGQSIDDPLWKLPLYDRAPVADIVIGDSQMERLDPRWIAAVAGRPYANLAYGGGTLRESISTFWHAAATAKLHSVYFGMTFLAYNPNLADRAAAAESMLQHRAQYFYDPGVLQTTVYDALALMPAGRVNIGPGMSKDSFWHVQLDSVRNRYTGMLYPSALVPELARIREYCRNKGIQLVFVIPPQHLDAQHLVAEAGATAEYSRFKRDIASFGPALDCDVNSALTEDRGNYNDPFHLTDEAAVRLVTDIWSGANRYCRPLPAARASSDSAAAPTSR